MPLRENNRLLIAATLAAFALIAVFHLASAKAGHSHYRDQHLGTAIEYAKGHIDLKSPVIVGFNATGTPTPQEVPFWAALAAIAFKIFGPWFGWANLTSLVIYATGLWPLWQLAKSHIGTRGAWWTVLFLLAQPILILMGGQASSDGLSFVLSIWFVFFAERLVRTGSAAWLAPSIVFGALTALTKLPLFLCTGLASFFLLLLHSPRSAKCWLMLIATGLVSGLLFLRWTHYTDSCIASAVFPYVDLRATYGSKMWAWYFGDWHFRLNPFNWAKGGWAALNSLFGSFALAALAGWAVLCSKNRLAQFWFAAAFITTLIFSHLVLVHRHYFILYSPAVAMLCATAIMRLEEKFNLQKPWQHFAATAGILLVVFAAVVQGLVGIKITLDYDPYPHKVAAIVRDHTSPQDRLLIQGGGWGGEILILAQRQGMTIDDTHILEDAAKREKLRALGYNKLVMISESPLLNALQQVDPGNLSRERVSYRESLTPVAEPFKTVFESPDVLVKELPEKAP